MTAVQRWKDNARSYAGEYLRRGHLRREPCEQCGSAQSQMHHEDYNQPLRVRWLCRPCHLALHQNLGVQAHVVPTRRRRRRIVATRRRDAVLKLRLQADQKTRWEKLAYAAGLNLSEWIRGMVDGTLTMSHAHTAAPEVVPAPKAPDLPVPPPSDKLAVARSLLGGDRQATLAKLRGEPVESRAPVGRVPKAPAEVLREVRATAQANPGLNPVVLAERFVGRYPEHAEAIRAAVAGLEDQTA